VPPGETRAVKECFRHPESLEAAVSYYRQLSSKLSPGHRRKIAVPTVALAGQDDIMSVRAYEKAASRFTGPYDVVSLPGGHFLHREHPDAFIDALVTVLRARRATL